VIEDPNSSGGEGITFPRDGLFRSASMYVTGPRAQRVPALTYAARAKVLSANVGPWSVSGTAADRTLTVRVDTGLPMLGFNVEAEYEGYGADELISGELSVALPTATAYVPATVAPLLNANATFHERAIAYVDEATGKLGIRSRGVLAKSPAGDITKRAPQANIRLIGMPAGTGMFSANAFGVASGSIQARLRADPANNDPKASFTDPTKILYTLDPVDDLLPGTYMINVEFADAGRGPNNNPEPPFEDYITPSIAVATFQVKQATLEKPIADGCVACHWSEAGVGFVLDYPRHHKPFNEQALDQCGGCHDYSSGQDSTKAATSFSSGHPIAKRVHAVHNGVNLNYPTITVAHEETGAFGRNWQITYPMNIRNCESCHPAATTSGSWQTNPNRIACMGCHDSDAATAHMKSQVFDPTPLANFSGDEEEACKACH
jgi:predicted CXXCH cytochrome family protein